MNNQIQCQGLLSHFNQVLYVLLIPGTNTVGLLVTYSSMISVSRPSTFAYEINQPPLRHISFTGAVNAKLICVLVFAYAKIRFLTSRLIPLCSYM